MCHQLLQMPSDEKEMDYNTYQVLPWEMNTLQMRNPQ